MIRRSLPILALACALFACKDDEVFGGGGDDDSTGDDDTTEEIECEEFTYHRDWGESWSWGADNTVANADASWVGECLGDGLGTILKNAGDLDGDGFDDLVVGDLTHEEVAGRRGKAYLVFGRGDTWEHGSLASELPSVLGPWREDGANLNALRIPGDVDGDGFADLVLELANNPGRDGFFLIHGSDAEWPVSRPVEEVASRITQAGSEEELGKMHARSGPADLDGDGRSDLLVTVARVDAVGSAFCVVDGDHLPGDLVLTAGCLAWVTVEGHDLDERGALGDLSGDGIDELFAGSAEGLELFLFGRTGDWPAGNPLEGIADVVLDLRDDIGVQWSYIDAGDLNGDGIHDLAVKNHREESGPEQGLYLFFGGPGLPRTPRLADADVHIAGGTRTFDVQAVGDVNGDGVDDLAWDGYPEGVEEQVSSDVYVVFGRTGPWPAAIPASEADVKLVSACVESHGCLFGGGERYRPGYSGDLDGDGIDELFLATGYQGPNSEPVGRITVFAGRTTWPGEVMYNDESVTFTGSENSQAMGNNERTLLMDLNGDGLDDLIVTSTKHPTVDEMSVAEEKHEPGEVFVFFGKPRQP